MARLYLDECVDVEVAERLNELGYDTVTARDMEMLGADDPDHLAIATRLQRILFTHNRDDFVALGAQWFLDGVEHCGILWSARAYPYYVTNWIVAGLNFYPTFANHVHRVPPEGHDA